MPFGETDALERVIDVDTATVILETVPATKGTPVADKYYFSHARDLCDRKGALLIADEVQTGLGRTGKMWGIEHFAVEPDVMVIGKGLCRCYIDRSSLTQLRRRHFGLQYLYVIEEW